MTTFNSFQALAAHKKTQPPQEPIAEDNLFFQYIRQGIIEIIGSGEVRRRKRCKTVIGHVSKIKKVVKFLENNPEEERWKSLQKSPNTSTGSQETGSLKSNFLTTGEENVSDPSKQRPN